MQISELAYDDIIEDCYFFFRNYFPVCELINQKDNMYFHFIICRLDVYNEE